MFHRFCECSVVAVVLDAIAEMFGAVAVGFGTVAAVLGAVVRSPKNTLVLTKKPNFSYFYGLLTSNDQCAQSHFPFSKIWVHT
jgi:hypothetical protein